MYTYIIYQNLALYKVILERYKTQSLPLQNIDVFPGERNGGGGNGGIFFFLGWFFNLHYILCISVSVSNILYPVLCILYSVFLYSVSNILYPVLCFQYFCIRYHILYISCIRYYVFCVLYPVSCVLYSVFCIQYYVSCILCPVSCIHNVSYDSWIWVSFVTNWTYVHNSNINICVLQVRNNTFLFRESKKCSS